MTTYKDAIGTELLGNVLLGKTPTFSGWTVDPAANVNRLTDGSLSASMTSGSNVIGAPWVFCHINFAVPNGAYLVGGYGKVDATVGDSLMYALGSSGKQTQSVLIAGTLRFFDTAFVWVDDGVLQFGLSSDAASTVTPDLYELWASRTL